MDAFADRALAVMPALMRNMMASERNWVSRGLLTLPQLWALQILDAGRAAGMRDLVRSLGFKASTATGIVDRLVALGLARRQADAADRRLVHLAITAKGRRILGAIRHEKRRMTIRLFATVPAADREVYLRVLERVAAGLDRPTEAGAR
jgi:DNA-binding MarR family transcriptional regulator